MLKLGVLTSGTGTNLQAIINAIEDKKLNAEIKIVVSNKNSLSLDRARHHNINSVYIPHKQYSSRKYFEKAIIHELQATNVELASISWIYANFIFIFCFVFQR